MFDLFKYFIYVVRGSLDYFDPVTDMLVSEDTYLTWRRHNDEVPRGGIPYAGSIKDAQLNQWVVLRFDRRTFFDGVEDWLESHAKVRGGLGAYKASKFRGLFRENPPYFDIPTAVWHKNKIPLAEEFLAGYIGYPGWLRREVANLDAPTPQWNHLRQVIIRCLLDG